MFYKTSVFVICCITTVAISATDSGAVAPSQYGQIQAVKNYSSNPFWNTNSPYNQQTVPKAIYATGADLTTSDCNTITESLMSDFCASNNNCTGMRLANVRPQIMAKLSQMPGYNFATACSGYIDSAFNKYAKNGVTVTAPLTTNTNTNTTTTNHYTFQNPYAPTTTNYQAGVADRANQLEKLRVKNNPNNVGKIGFPTTVSSLSANERKTNATAGYEPYKELSAYKIPKFESEEDFLARTANNRSCTDPEHMTKDCKCTASGAQINSAGKCFCPNGEDIEQGYCPFNVNVYVEGKLRHSACWNGELYTGADIHSLDGKFFALKSQPVQAKKLLDVNGLSPLDSQQFSIQDSTNQPNLGDWSVLFNKSSEDLIANKNSVWLYGDSKCEDGLPPDEDTERATEGLAEGDVEHITTCYCRIKEALKAADYPGFEGHDDSYPNSTWIKGRSYVYVQDKNDPIQILTMRMCKEQCTTFCVRDVILGLKDELYPCDYINSANEPTPSPVTASPTIADTETTPVASTQQNSSNNEASNTSTKINYELDGTDFCCYEDFQSDCPDTELYNATREKTKFAVKFDYGIITGISACPNHDEWTDRAEITEDNYYHQYCWCKLTSIANNTVESKWVHVSTFQDGTDCYMHCSHSCGKHMKTTKHIRQSLYNAVTNMPKL